VIRWIIGPLTSALALGLFASPLVSWLSGVSFAPYAHLFNNAFLVFLFMLLVLMIAIAAGEPRTKRLLRRKWNHFQHRRGLK
jgi:hypothetical protein